VPYLVDSDILIDVSKNNQGAIDYLDSLADRWWISVVTALETIVGARSRAEADRIHRFLSALPIIPLGAGTGTTAYDLLLRFAHSHGLRAFDALQAATALEAGYALVTRNERHYRVIPGIRLEVPPY
jgi:predicted nucleic acid-binding protein